MSFAMQGVWVAMATPLLESRRIDQPAMLKLATHLTDAGVDGLFLYGSTGEGPSLSLSEKVAAAKFLAAELKGRLPLIAGSLMPTTSLVIDEVAQLQDTGISAMVVTTPYFYRPDNAESLLLHFRAVAEISRLPLVVYNVPVRTGTMLSVDEISKIRDLGTYVGLKDSSLNFAHMQTAIQRLGSGFSITDGSEENWIVSGALGASGATLGIANICPEWCVQAWKLAKEGQMRQAQRVNQKILEVRNLCFTYSSVYGGLKECLQILGFGGRTVSLPMTNLRVDEQQQLAERLATFDLRNPVAL